MLVPLAVAATCAVYLATLPVKLAFALRLGPEPRLGMGLAAFGAAAREQPRDSPVIER